MATYEDLGDGTAICREEDGSEQRVPYPPAEPLPEITLPEVPDALSELRNTVDDFKNRLEALERLIGSTE